jgi:hypothetical protein
MKLNLRDFFWLILVAAVASLWWIDRTQLAAELRIYKSPQMDAVTEPTPLLLDQVQKERDILLDKIRRESERSVHY